MADYKCEDLSLCENFQSAICLHCNRRLCVRHIIEHDKIVFSDVRDLSNQVEILLQQIKDKSEKNRFTYDDLLPTFDKWRIQELEKIEQIYENEAQLIRYEGERLEDFHRDLFEQLERDARQPLERIQRQQNTNKEILNDIRQTIEKIREECVDLKWKSPTPSPVDTEYSPSDFPPIPIQVQTSTAGIVYDKKNENIGSSSLDLSNKLNQKQSTTDKNALSQLSSISSTFKAIKLTKGRPRKRLVRMFSNISSIKQSKDDIASYKGGRKLMILITAYLTAWHRKSKASEKTFLLNEHISTIKKYLGNRKSDFDVLVGIQAFFYNHAVRENKYEMMKFLLQFFLNHQCINKNLIFEWYNSNDAHGYMGFEEAKQLAEPFIMSL